MTAGAALATRIWVDSRWRSRAFALTWLMQSLLYEVRPNDPITFVAVTARCCSPH